MGAPPGAVVELSTDREARRLDEARRAVVVDPVLWTASGLGAGWLALYAAATAATAATAEDTEERQFLGAIVYLVPVALATALSVVAARRATGRPRKLWSLLVVSNVLWLVGARVWAGFAYQLSRQAPFT